MSDVSLNQGGKKAKAADPQFFHGDRKKLREFFAQVSIKFATNPELFPDELSKVGYAASYLRGHDFSLYASMMPDGVMPSATYSEFRRFLQKQQSGVSWCSRGYPCPR
ncbi:hypothetical protein V1509DRAFT_635460 [Lipomyces kononenkoae]